MRYLLLKIAACALLLFSSIMLHAQDDDPGTGMEDEEGNVNEEALEAPVDDHLLCLAVAGIALGVFRHKIRKS